MKITDTRPAPPKIAIMAFSDVPNGVPFEASIGGQPGTFLLMKVGYAARVQEPSSSQSYCLNLRTGITFYHLNHTFNVEKVFTDHELILRP